MHDAFGNRLTARDPMNNLTIWTYDTAFNLYPATERNALNQTRSFTTSFPCGLRSQEIDLNGLQTNSTYDVFCRKIREERPATGFYEATAYLSFGNPAEQRVETSRPHPDGGAPVTKSEFFRRVRAHRRICRVTTGRPARTDLNLPGRQPPASCVIL